MPKTLKSVWSAIFRRKGENGAYTRLFEALDISQQMKLLEKSPLHDAELAVIGSLSDDWLFLTTDRIVWCMGGNRFELPVHLIADANPDMLKLKRDNIRKDEIRELDVSTLAGNKFTIAVEPGAPFMGVWNVLKHIGGSNRHRLQDPRT